MPIEVHDEENEDIDNGAVARAAADDVLFSILKDVRKKLSKKCDVPPFVIFQDPSLEAMATTYPITMEELMTIPGVGASKAKRYGDEFLRVIKEYVEENEIIRPEDLRIRTVAKKSTRKNKSLRLSTAVWTLTTLPNRTECRWRKCSMSWRRLSSRVRK